MKPDLPGLPTIWALMLAAVLTAWLGIWGPISLEGLAKWQTLIGAFITAGGIFVAAYNVTRQMRAAARTREEDRLERDIPGLQSAHGLIESLGPMFWTPFDHSLALRAVEFVGIDRGRGLAKELERLIPAAPDQVRRDLSGLLFAVCHYAEMKTNSLDYIRQQESGAASDDRHLASARTVLDMCERQYPGACANLKEYSDQLARRVVRGRARLLLLRREHERQLGL